MVKKGKALKDSDAQNISGGYVHKIIEKVEKKLEPGTHIISGEEGFYDFVPKWEVINDETGERMGDLYDTVAKAQKAAAEIFKQKTKVISDDAVKHLRVEYELKSD